jgi:hypothetical protein
MFVVLANEDGGVADNQTNALRSLSLFKKIKGGL